MANEKIHYFGKLISCVLVTKAIGNENGTDKNVVLN